MGNSNFQNQIGLGTGPDRAICRPWFWLPMGILALIVMHGLVWAPQVFGAPVGSEFRINTTTTGIQRTTFDSMPAVAVDGAGNFVVVWTSEGQDSGVTKGVYGQRFNASGVPQGGEFLVNTTVAGDQLDPAVAMDATGNFVVSWTGLDAAGMGVFFQRFNAAGTPQGSETQANTYTTSDQKWSGTAMDAVGNFVVVWASYGQDGSRTGVYGQRYNATGVPQGSEMHISTQTLYEQDSPVVSMNASGAFVVCWSSWAQDSGNSWGSYAQRFNAAGTPQGSEFRTNSTTTSEQWYNRVAMDDSGNFTVVWESRRQDSVNDGGVFAQRYDAAGTPQGGEFGANTNTTGEQWEAAVATTSAGDFVIVWGSDGQDGSEGGIYGQQYLANGTPDGGEFHISTTTSGMQERPAVAMVSGEEFVVVWSGNGTGDDAGIFGQRFAPAPPAADVVTNTNDSGMGSLRAALDYANLNPGTTITFDIPDTDIGYETDGSDHWWRIAPTSALPSVIADGIVIDGPTQTANRGNTNTRGPEIEIHGANAGTADGLQLVTGSNGSTIRGLVINQFIGDAIEIYNSSNNTITGCYLGLDATGTMDRGNTQYGVRLANGAQNNTIGGTTAAFRNVISGNEDGIYLEGPATTGNLVQGNYIGTDAAGTGDLGNDDRGVQIESGADNNTIGGGAVGAGNVISGNDNGGLVIGDGSDPGLGATGNRVQGNKIGTDYTGTVPLGNEHHGVQITVVDGNSIGGINEGEGNIVANNTWTGVLIQNNEATGNEILRNAIYANGGRGIDIGDDGVTPNNGTKNASLANSDMDFPVFTTAQIGGTLLTVTGYVGNAPDQSLFAGARVEVFENDGDSSGYGEGLTYLGFLTADAGGNFSGTLDVTGLGLAVGEEISGTATDAGGNTSEFAANVAVVAAPLREISGLVFEDADYAGTATGYDSGVGDRALANVDVELYGAGDIYLASVTTAGDGSFSFTGLSDGTFKVRVRSATIGDADTPPANGLHPTVPATWPYPLADMTWGHGSALIGGQDPSVDDTSTGDNVGPGDTWVAVTISGADVGAVNFGFNYDLVVNGDDDLNPDNARSKQGCLRQFIKNSNSMVGVSKSWFQIP